MMCDELPIKRLIRCKSMLASNSPLAFTKSHNTAIAASWKRLPTDQLPILTSERVPDFLSKRFCPRRNEQLSLPLFLKPRTSKRICSKWPQSPKTGPIARCPASCCCGCCLAVAAVVPVAFVACFVWEWVWVFVRKHCRQYLWMTRWRDHGHKVFSSTPSNSIMLTNKTANVVVPSCSSVLCKQNNLNRSEIGISFD